MFLWCTIRSPFTYATSSKVNICPHWNWNIFKTNFIKVCKINFYLVRWSTKFSSGQAIRFRQNTRNSVFFVSLKSFHLATSVPNIGLANNEAEDEDVCDLSMPPWHPWSEWRIANQWRFILKGKNKIWKACNFFWF